MIKIRVYLSILIICCFSLSFLVVKEAAFAATPKEKYFKAEAAYKKLSRSKKKKKYRDNWLSCINDFQAVYKQDPSGPWAPAGMYQSGKIYLELYKYSGKKSDKKEAIDHFERLIKRYPKSSYKNKAKKELRQIPKSKTSKTGTSKKSPIKKKKTTKKKKSYAKKNHTLKKKQPISTSGSATVKYLRYSTYPDFTRVVIEVDKETEYAYGFLRKDPKLNKPMRMYIDVKNSRLGKKLKKILPQKENKLRIPINKNLEVKVSQNSPNKVRVVMYNLPYKGKSFSSKHYVVKTYYNPYRIVMDVKGKVEKIDPSDEKLKNTYLVKKRYKPSSKHKASASKNKMSSNDLARQLSLGVRRIVIDPGHGGRDYGAPGYYKGVHEKNVVLQIAKRLAKKIRKDLKYEVILTRTNDRFLTLEERTRFANRNHADLFISLHANSSRNKRAYGIETYFLNLATDDEAIRVAAKENATSKKNISDLQDILTDIMQNAKIYESNRLATHVQGSLYYGLKKKYSYTKNKGVKQAPFYVLLGAKMPSILVETAFLSNPRECKRLTDPKYQDKVCDSIVHGIKKYVKEINST